MVAIDPNLLYVLLIAISGTLICAAVHFIPVGGAPAAMAQATGIGTVLWNWQQVQVLWIDNSKLHVRLRAISFNVFSDGSRSNGFHGNAGKHHVCRLFGLCLWCGSSFCLGPGQERPDHRAETGYIYIKRNTGSGYSNHMFR